MFLDQQRTPKNKVNNNTSDPQELEDGIEDFLFNYTKNFDLEQALKPLSGMRCCPFLLQHLELDALGRIAEF